MACMKPEKSGGAGRFEITMDSDGNSNTKVWWDPEAQPPSAAQQLELLNLLFGPLLEDG
jgi:hypothetical protein